MIDWINKIMKKIIKPLLSDRDPFVNVPVMSRRAQYLSVKGVINKKYYG